MQQHAASHVGPDAGVSSSALQFACELRRGTASSTCKTISDRLVQVGKRDETALWRRRSAPICMEIAGGSGSPLSDGAGAGDRAGAARHAEQGGGGVKATVGGLVQGCSAWSLSREGPFKIVQGCEQQSRTHLLSSMLTVVSASAATSSSASESASLHDGSLLPAACTDACSDAASMATITFGLYWGLQHGHGEHAQETWQHRMREDGGV